MVAGPCREPPPLQGSRKSAPDYNPHMASATGGSSRSGQSLDIRLVVDRIPALTWSRHPDESVEFMNQRRREYAGLSPEESQCSGYQVAVHSEHSPADGQANLSRKTRRH
jgi:PAS domain-containing protein